jgi:hypothetical protein
MSFYSSLGKRSSKTRYVPYPNRFFSLADYYMPTDIRQLFHWCVYFYYKNPVVGSTVNSMASYPITDLTYSVEGESTEVKDKWKDIMEKKLHMKRRALELGLDSFVFGNGIVLVYYPFTRYLKCKRCGKRVDITNTDNHDKRWKGKMDSKGYKFTLDCPHCSGSGEAEVVDVDSSIVDNMNIVRVNPRDIDIEFYEITGSKKYFYAIPQATRNKVKTGKDKFLIKTMPKVYLDAISMNKTVELNPENVFHLSGNSVAGADQAWGKPLIIHSLQKLFYVYTLIRAQEAIATQKIVPMDIIHPASMGEASIVDHVNLTQWQERVKDEVEMWRIDPNYISVMPLPIGIQRMGGEGRMLLLTPEIQQNTQEIIAGMGAPQEFVFGGLTWTGSSVSLRMLENKIHTHRDGVISFLQFVADAVARITDLPKCEMGMTELRMADDMSRMQLYTQLNAANKLSDEDFLGHLGISHTEQYEKIQKEMKVRAHLASLDMLNTASAQGEAMIINAEYSAKAQIAQTKVNNLAMNDLDNSLPVIQREGKRVNDILNLKMLNMQLMQAIMQEQQMMQGGPPPSDGGAEGAPEDGEEPPPEDEGSGGQQAPPPAGQAPTGPEQEASSSTAEPPAVMQQQAENPFYEKPRGPDIEALLKRWATKIKNDMPPDEAAKTMAYLWKKDPKMAARVQSYITLTPMGGTSSDANDAMRMRKRV